MASEARRSLLRNHGGGHAPVSYLELFFDLVYVFAITQLSHYLHRHLGLIGLVQSAVLFFALWWAWMYTTWAANWANPESLWVRIMLLAMMLLSLMMSVALPDAFAARGLLFAASYIALQVGRTLCMAAMFHRSNPANARNMLRITVWFAASAVFWIAGVVRSEEERLAWWLIALGIEYAGPLSYFVVPGFGYSRLNEWDISGSHMAERCALFIIIALGEGIVVTGSAVAEVSLDGGRATAFAMAFASSVLMWWLYFDLGAERGAAHIQSHAEPGRVARSAYTYLHMPIVAGIVVFAVADALVLEEWQAAASRGLVAVQCGGGAVFLTGLGLFKRFSSRFGNVPLSHLVGIALFALLAIWGWLIAVPTLLFSGLGVVIYALVAVWEWGSYHGGWRERLEAVFPALGRK